MRQTEVGSQVFYNFQDIYSPLFGLSKNDIVSIFFQAGALISHFDHGEEVNVIYKEKNSDPPKEREQGRVFIFRKGDQSFFVSFRSLQNSKMKGICEVYPL